MIIATLSTGPVILADKAGETNTTLVWRSARSDGLILQPDKPATSIDATFQNVFSQNAAPTLHGHIWSTHVAVESKVNGELMWHYLLSIDVNESWQLSEGDFFPRLDSHLGWVGRRWHDHHWPTPCVHGRAAVSSGCLLSPTISAEEHLPKILNDRPIMVANDSHRFDLLQLSPVLKNGWVLLGEVNKYVSVSSRRFTQVSMISGGMRVEVAGSPGEEIHIIGLQPNGLDWTIVEKAVRFKSSKEIVEFTVGTKSLPDLASPKVASERISFI